MQPTRILPDLQCSLLCEEIRQEITGNFILIGVINLIRVPQLPVVAFKLVEGKFTLQDASLHATNVIGFSQVEFKTAGTYYIEVLVDDVMKLRYPVPVVVAPPQQQAHPPAPGQAAG